MRCRPPDPVGGLTTARRLDPTALGPTAPAPAADLHLPHRLIPLLAATAALALASTLAACGSDSSGDEWPELAEPDYPPVSEVLTGLEGLSIDDFFERSFEALIARSPETATDLGLEAWAGGRNNFLDDVSASFLDDTYDLLDGLLARLRAYDRASLTAAQRTSYDVYEWYLEDAARERPFRDYSYSVSPYLTSEHQKLLSLFTQVHPLDSAADARDYVERLWRVRDKLAQVKAGLERRASAGLLPPRLLLEPGAGQLRSLASADPTNMPLYTTLAARLTELDLDASERSSLLEEAERAVRLSVKPALEDLAAAAGRYVSGARGDDGVWALPGGDDYYAYALRHHTTLETTAAEVHAYGLTEVDRIEAELRQRFDALGYPAGESMTQLFARVVQDGGRVAAADCLATYSSLVDEAGQRMAPAIDVSPVAEVQVHGDAYGGYYVPASPDGSRPGVFYAYVPASGLPRYGMPTLAYHEAIPGHHTQIALARELTGLPTFRGAILPTASTEGWALYAERLASELGWYDGDPYGDLGRLQYELLRAARLVADTGVNAEHWTYAEAVAYLRDTIGFPSETLNVGNEALRYVAWPGQATAYSTGLRAILAAREARRAADGASFDLRAFHREVLTAGVVPLPVLERLVAPAQ